MKHTEHTPGPWVVDRDPYGRAVYIQHPDTKVNGGWVVATVWGDDKEANARIMAAAPDLLAALQACSDRMAELQKHTNYPLAWPRELARAAIAKATGQG